MFNSAVCRQRWLQQITAADEASPCKGVAAVEEGLPSWTASRRTDVAFSASGTNHVVFIDFEDFVHTFNGDDDAAEGSNSTSCQARTSCTRNHDRIVFASKGLTTLETSSVVAGRTTTCGSFIVIGVRYLTVMNTVQVYLCPYKHIFRRRSGPNCSINSGKLYLLPYNTYLQIIKIISLHLLLHLVMTTRSKTEYNESINSCIILSSIYLLRVLLYSTSSCM